MSRPININRNVYDSSKTTITISFLGLPSGSANITQDVLSLEYSSTKNNSFLYGLNRYPLFAVSGGIQSSGSMVITNAGLNKIVNQTFFKTNSEIYNMNDFSNIRITINTITQNGNSERDVIYGVMFKSMNNSLTGLQTTTLDFEAIKIQHNRPN